MDNILAKNQQSGSPTSQPVPLKTDDQLIDSQLASRQNAAINAPEQSQLAGPASDIAQQKVSSGIEKNAAALGMNNSATQQALSNRYGHMAKEEIERIKVGADAQQAYKKSQLLSEAQGFFTGKQQIQNSAYSAQMQAYQAQMAARNQMISTVLGLAGTLGGAYLGGMKGAAEAGAGQLAAGSANSQAFNAGANNYSVGYNQPAAQPATNYGVGNGGFNY